MTENKGVLRRCPVVIFSEGIATEKFKEIAEIMRGHFRFEQYGRDVGSVK